MKQTLVRLRQPHGRERQRIFELFAALEGGSRTRCAISVECLVVQRGIMQCEQMGEAAVIQRLLLTKAFRSVQRGTPDALVNWRITAHIIAPAHVFALG